MAVQQIAEYIRQHRDTYTREAIDRQLLDAGYPREEIAAAWDALSGSEAQQGSALPLPPGRTAGWGDEYATPPHKPKKVVSSWIFWLVLVGFILLSYGLPVLLLFIAPRDQYGGPNSAFTSSGLYGALFLQLMAIVVGIILLRRDRPLAMGLLTGVLMTVVVLPFAALVIGLGVCIVLLSGPRF